MKNLFALIVLVIIANESLGLRLRHKRQAVACTGKNCTPSTSTTPRVLTTDECMLSCSRTAEYNPICGTDNVVYPNPGQLLCAQYCGKDVQESGPAPCPTAAATGA